MIPSEPAHSPPPAGLTSADAARLLGEAGPNELGVKSERPAWHLLVAQFNSPVIWLLLAACLVSALVGALVDAAAIGTIVLINGLFGFFQEYRAEKAVFALRAMTAPRARVIRDGRTQVIAAAAVVPGDLLVLEAGDVVAADALLLEANALTAMEAALTGESTPVEKTAKPADPDAPVAQRSDHVFAGTHIGTGTGLAEIVATGMRTQLGRIAEMLTAPTDESTPLQARLGVLSRRLMLICLGIVLAVTILGWRQGLTGLDLLLPAISLAVAAVPEGLPAIVTIALAVGMQRMAARHALVRRLTAVETLGCATVICTDKTGTLTTGVMAVREIWGEDPLRVLDAAVACSDAELSSDGKGGVGDPTEVAIMVAAASRNIHRNAIEAGRPRLSVHPFDADRKCMSIYREDGLLYAKGAIETICARSTTVADGAEQAASNMAARGLRVLAIAIGRANSESDLDLVGLLGIADPPRTEAIEAIARARAAGIRTVMITGDHKLTAEAIAGEMGILQPGQAADEVVHARATPEDKLTIVRKWKSRGEIVAMTGDGVNDAPALHEAHIGIAMGQTGTEVTRGAADIVLADDNYATIVAAVEEGRGIFENIRKSTAYLVAGNMAELAVVFVGALLGYSVILLPIHLLWINLVTDGLPALALVTDRGNPTAMSHPPRSPSEQILGRAEWQRILLAAAVQTICVVGVFLWARDARDMDDARNLAFSVLVFGELLRAFSAQDPARPFWEVGLFSNVKLLLIVSLSLLVQLAIHHIPFTQEVFRIGALSLGDCALSLGVGALPLLTLELEKLVRLRRAHDCKEHP